MEIVSSKEQKIYNIQITGDLDASSSVELDKHIAEAISSGETRMIVNCKGISYISSAGLGVFMSYIQDIETHKIKMVLYGMEEKIKNVFSILGLDGLIEIVETKEDAVRRVDE